MRNSLAFLLFGALVFVSFTTSPQKLTSWFLAKSTVEQEVIGKISTVSGSAYINKTHLESSQPLKLSDKISLAPETIVSISLNESDFEFELISAVAVFKKRKDQLILIIESGYYRPLSKATVDMRVIKNSRVYSADSFIELKTPTYRPVIKDAITQAPLIVSEAFNDLPTTTHIKSSKIEKKDSLDSEPDNAFLDALIADQAEKFQNCQVNRIRELGTVKGQVIVGLEIHPEGLIKNAKILDTDIEDTELMNCLLSVFQRIKMPKYKGEVIYRSYPLLFE